MTQLHPELARAVLGQRRLAYVVADRKFRIQTVGGDLSLLTHGLDQMAVELGARPALGPSAELRALLPEMDEGIAEALLSGALPQHRLELVNRESVDGKTLYLDLLMLPWPDAEGGIGGIAVVAEDATARGKREQRITQQHNELQMLRDQLARQNLELRAAVAELRQLDDLKNLFISVAAHELRSPLASMLAYLEILLDGAFGEIGAEQKPAIEVVQSSAQRLLQITNDLLDVTWIESGHIDIVLQPTDLAQLLHVVVAELSPRVEAREQTLTLDCAGGLPLALCDPARGSQILGNLLDNAHKYTPEGGRIDVRLARAAEDGFLQITVADSGPGIDAEDLPRLFGRFFRAANVAESGAAGAGLGLFITRSLVELHGGRIWYEIDPGGGSVFHVTLPIDDSVD